MSPTALTNDELVLLFRNLVRASHFDQLFSRRMVNGQLLGFYHPGEGHLAPGVGAATFLRQDDYLTPHHRAHGMPHMLAKGIDLKLYLAEHTGKATGCCQGRSSFHFCFPSHGVYLMSGFIGYNFPVATGFGFAAQRARKGQVVVTCSGDGSYGQGRAHEAMLMAANWKLPVVFLCENNGMAIYSEIEKMHPTPDIADLAHGYGMPGVVVDGQDVFAVAEAVRAAVARARSGLGPSLVEAKAFRFREHDIGTRDLVGSTPRDKELVAELREHDPVKLAAQRLLATKVLSRADVDRIHEEAAAEVEAAERFADESPFPDVTAEDLRAAVYAR